MASVAATASVAVVASLGVVALGCTATETPPPIDAAVPPRDVNIDAYFVPPVVPTVEDYCASPSHCDDGNPCTDDTCEPASPVRFEGTCAHVRIDGCVPPPDAGRPDGGGYDAGTGPASPVDPSCDSSPVITPVLVPYVPLGEPEVERGCEQGIEWQNCSGSITLRQNRAGSGARGRTLVVDLATYTAPDRLRIQGIDEEGAAYLLLDTCRVRTSELGDPTDGRSRPPDEMIRRFEIRLREGTRSLTLDASAAPTPWYMRVLGTCDFDVDVVSSSCAAALRDCVP